MTSPYHPEEESGAGSKAFWVKCGPCGHIWAAAYYPGELAKVARIIGRATCPKCGERKRVFLAKQSNGVLQEPTVA